MPQMHVRLLSPLDKGREHFPAGAVISAETAGGQQALRRLVADGAAEWAESRPAARPSLVMDRKAKASAAGA